MEAAEKAARIVRTVIETLKPGFAVRLWTGERIGPATGPVLTINDQDIVWQVVKRPSLSTLIEMWISKTIDIEDFVDLDEIDPLYFDRPYYVAPKPEGAKPYKLLLEAMEKKKKVGIARVVMWTKEYLCALRPLNGVLLIGLALGGGALARALSTPVAVYLGKSSYAMYILHVPVLWWCLRRSPEFPPLVYMAIVIAISSLVYGAFEEPANRKLRSSRRDPVRQPVPASP